MKEGTDLNTEPSFFIDIIVERLTKNTTYTGQELLLESTYG
jgi:hypothetical protein